MPQVVTTDSHTVSAVAEPSPYIHLAPALRLARSCARRRAGPPCPEKAPGGLAFESSVWMGRTTPTRTAGKLDNRDDGRLGLRARNGGPPQLWERGLTVPSGPAGGGSREGGDGSCLGIPAGTAQGKRKEETSEPAMWRGRTGG